ncbi:MAG: hypothetical protein MJK15_09585 [Colwellia sp.]|nr:hypothetical protein [Colwellia sp.]
MSNILSIGGSSSKYKLTGSKPAGFLAGFWHGIIFPITFLVSLFNPNVSVFESNNNGKVYQFGMLIGIVFFFENDIAIHYGITVL